MRGGTYPSVTFGPENKVLAWMCQSCGTEIKINQPGIKINQSNMVNHPSYYNTGKIEVIEAIDDWKLGFYEGQVVKYVARAKHKGNELQDLKKAQWYLNRKIEQLEKEK